jgi:CRP/FNR family cyclic AMP-dependent transcriptional regulator
MPMVAFRVNKDEKTALLNGVELFSSCTRDELRRIGSLTTPVEVKEGTLLARQGQPGQEFFVVIEGTAVATRNGRELHHHGPGSFFGEMALLDGGERTATVDALTDMHLLVLTRNEFMTLQETAPSVAFKLLVGLGTRLRRADQVIDELLEGQVPVFLPTFWKL